MYSKPILLTLFFTVILVTSALTMFFLDQKDDNEEYRLGDSIEFDAAINQARYIYNLRQKDGVDFASGPCLTNALMPGWVLDLVHNPRESIDDLLENQCRSFTEGSAKHFVELDINGNFVRAR